MIEVVKNPSFKPVDFDPARKKPGITAILRLKNEEDYVAQALSSILPFFDEFVIVYNQCTDRTPQIVEQFAGQEPNRLRAFHYVPEVFPQGSAMHEALPGHHVSSLVHYSNFAYSKVSYRICVIWDGDMIAAPKPLSQIVSRLRGIKPWTVTWWRSPWKMGWWWFSGVNLWDHEGKIFVPKTRPKLSGKKDHGFWPAGPRNVWKYHPIWEVLNTTWLLPTYVGFVYFHVKGMKKDRGLGVYQLAKNPRSIFNKLKHDPLWSSPELMSFDEYCQIEPEARSLPNPEALGIRPLRSYAKAAAILPTPEHWS